MKLKMRKIRAASIIAFSLPFFLKAYANSASDLRISYLKGVQWEITENKNHNHEVQQLPQRNVRSPRKGDRNQQSKPAALENLEHELVPPEEQVIPKAEESESRNNTNSNSTGVRFDKNVPLAENEGIRSQVDLDKLYNRIDKMQERQFLNPKNKTLFKNGWDMLNPDDSSSESDAVSNDAEISRLKHLIDTRYDQRLLNSNHTSKTSSCSSVTFSIKELGLLVSIVSIFFTLFIL